MNPDQVPHCSFCQRQDVRLVVGTRGRICEECALIAVCHFSQPPPLRQSGEVSKVQERLMSTLSLPTLFQPARKLARHLASPLNLPPGLLGHRDGRANHVLIVGPTGSGKTRLSLALRKVAPTAIVDVAQITASGHDGVPLSATVRALLRETGGDKHEARHGIVVLDNLDCWLSQPPDLHRRNLWWELLMYLEGCNVTYSDQAVLETDNVIFVGLFRSQTSPEGKGTRELLERGVPEYVIARMSLWIFLDNPTAEDLLAVLENANPPVFQEYQVTRSAREFLAVRAADLNFGAWGLRHVLSELDLLIGQEKREPKRIDAKFLERRF